jgi:HPt (histidine-containing phosphotransfer) domain-containing protein
MASGRDDKPIITTHDDHDVIVPPNPLRKAWAAPAPGAADPVARAERALAGLSDQFSGWMDSECARLDAACRDIGEKGLNRRTRNALFHAAHDIKGHAETLGFPLAAAAANSLCRLIEGTPEASPIPLVLIEQHVNAVKAIVREHARPNADQLAATLTTRLCAVTRDFLLHTTGIDPDAETIASPPTAPGSTGK